MIEDIYDIWYVASYFDLLYMGVDINGDVTLHESRIYESPDTKKKIEAFNIYMETEDGQMLGRWIDYTHYVPSGELTSEYILENTTNIIHMMSDPYWEGCHDQIMEIYKEIEEAEE